MTFFFTNLYLEGRRVQVLQKKKFKKKTYCLKMLTKSYHVCYLLQCWYRMTSPLLITETVVIYKKRAGGPFVAEICCKYKLKETPNFFGDAFKIREGGGRCSSFLIIWF